MKLCFALVIGILCVRNLHADPTNVDLNSGHPQRITTLPGAGPLPTNFNMYSGYLEAGKPTKKLFYWLNECEDKESKTLLIWFNGGPGCSSLYGLFEEHGPYSVVEGTLNLTRNNFSWNRFADTLYVEAPINTGFSHLTKNKSRITSDHNTVNDILEALEDFIENIQPQYSEYDVYLAGESYAGIYIPVMANRIMEQGHALADKFKGIILGNPELNKYLSSKALVPYAYYHGFIGRRDFDSLTSYDCFSSDAVGTYDEDIQNFCRRITDAFNRHMFHSDWNYFNYAQTCFRTETDSSIPSIDEMALGEDSEYTSFTDGDYYDYLILSDSNSTHTSNNSLNEEQSTTGNDSIETNDYNDEDPGLSREDQDACDQARSLEMYLSQHDVQMSIHAGDRGEWKRCNGDVKKTHKIQYDDMSSRVKKLINKYNKTALLYYGDQDLAINFLGGEEFVHGLGLRQTSARGRFYVEKENSQSIAGFYEEFEEKLAFAIVKGAGHMAPKDKPEEMFQLVSDWIDRFR